MIDSHVAITSHNLFHCHISVWIVNWIIVMCNGLNVAWDSKFVLTPPSTPQGRNIYQSRPVRSLSLCRRRTVKEIHLGCEIFSWTSNFSFLPVIGKRYDCSDMSILFARKQCCNWEFGPLVQNVVCSLEKMAQFSNKVKDCVFKSANIWVMLHFTATKYFVDCTWDINTHRAWES